MAEETPSKKVDFVGSSRKDIKEFPEEIKAGDQNTAKGY